MKTDETKHSHCGIGKFGTKFGRTLGATSEVLSNAILKCCMGFVSDAIAFK